MSRPIFEPSLERTDAALGYDKNQLQRRPRLQPADGIGDREIEFLWGGPKLLWFINPPGISNAVDFATWTQDLTLPWSGYLSNGGGSENDVCIFAAPLGPRYSVWHIDAVLGRGPDYGVYQIDILTKTMARRPGGYGLLDGGAFDSSSLRYDTSATIETLSGPYPPGVWDASIADGAGAAQDNWITDGSFNVDGYTAAAETLTNVRPEIGFSLRITGEYGQNLSAITNDGLSPLTGRTMDSGDGVMYYFRVRMADQNPASSGFKGRIQAFRLSRAFENDGTLI